MLGNCLMATLPYNSEILEVATLFNTNYRVCKQKSRSNVVGRANKGLIVTRTIVGYAKRYRVIVHHYVITVIESLIVLCFLYLVPPTSLHCLSTSLTLCFCFFLCCN